MQLGFTPRNPKETKSLVLETGMQAIFGGMVNVIHTLVIDLAVTATFFCFRCFA